MVIVSIRRANAHVAVMVASLMLGAMPRDRDPDQHDPAERIPADPARPERREPIPGPVDALQFDFTPVRARLHARPPRRWLPPAVFAIAVVLGLLLLFRRPLADRIWPETSAQALRMQAAQALAQGRLSAADGSGARELYEAALAMDPDRNEAREGLMQVAQAALAQARKAIAAGRFDDAHQDLALAQALSVPRAQADAVAAQLREREAARAGIAQLLARAAQARAEHRLDGNADAALPLYQRVLALQPERVEALEGREDALADLLQQARQALARGELSAAATTIAAARGYDAGHGDLPDAEAALARALEQARQQADGERRRGRLGQAADRYRALLAIDAGDSAARQGLGQVGVAWAHRAERLASDFRFADAKAALEQAHALAPKEAAVAAAVRHVARAQQAQARLGSTLAPGERRRRVRALLAEAAAAESRGDLLAPPGDSAFDKLRAARAIAPDDAAVRRASARLLPTARECFERELRGNNLGRADACLDAWQVLAGGNTAVARARRRLAERWLAFGDERLGAGELQRAASALAAARASDPATPGLDAFAQRLRAASASGD
jgi:tetratricopeptide (TPR) repeat protein